VRWLLRILALIVVAVRRRHRHVAATTAAGVWWKLAGNGEAAGTAIPSRVAQPMASDLMASELTAGGSMAGIDPSASRSRCGSRPPAEPTARQIHFAGWERRTEFLRAEQSGRSNVRRRTSGSGHRHANANARVNADSSVNATGVARRRGH
jgi:hypothetical protein